MTFSDAKNRAQQARAYLEKTVSVPDAKMNLSFRCIDLPSYGPEFDAFNDMVDLRKEISFATFARHVNWKPLAKEMGYATETHERGPRLKTDRAVAFFVSKLDDEDVYYLEQSRIEYVFKSTSNEKKIAPGRAWS